MTRLPERRDLRPQVLTDQAYAVFRVCADGLPHLWDELLAAGARHVPVAQAARFGAARDARSGRVPADPASAVELHRAAREKVGQLVRVAVTAGRLVRDDRAYTMPVGVVDAWLAYHRAPPLAGRMTPVREAPERARAVSLRP